MHWFNCKEAYTNAGRIAGKGRRRKDQGLVSHWEGWARNAYALETPEVAKLARAAFDEAYRDEATPF